MPWVRIVLRCVALQWVRNPQRKWFVCVLPSTSVVRRVAVGSNRATVRRAAAGSEPTAEVVCVRAPVRVSGASRCRGFESCSEASRFGSCACSLPRQWRVVMPWVRIVPRRVALPCVPHPQRKWSMCVLPSTSSARRVPVGSNRANARRAAVGSEPTADVACVRVSRPRLIVFGIFCAPSTLVQALLHVTRVDASSTFPLSSSKFMCVAHGYSEARALGLF